MANIGYLPRQDFAVQRTSPADILIRSVLIAAVFLSLWFSFHPFAALDEPIEVTEAGNLANQLGYSTLFVLLAAWNLLHQPQRLLLLVRPVLIATLLWFALTVATSWDPALSARRLAFALVTIGIAIVAVTTITRAATKTQALTALDYIEIQQLVNSYAFALDNCTNNGFDYADLYSDDGTFIDMWSNNGVKEAVSSGRAGTSWPRRPEGGRSAAQQARERLGGEIAWQPVGCQVRSNRGQRDDRVGAATGMAPDRNSVRDLKRQPLAVFT